MGYYFNPITYVGGEVLKTWIALDALLDRLGVKIERWSFLTFPKYTIGPFKLIK